MRRLDGGRSRSYLAGPTFREISEACGRSNAVARLSAMAGVIGKKSAEVILAEIASQSAKSHSKVADLASVKDRTQAMKRPGPPSTTTKPQGEVRHGYGTRAQKATSCVEADSLEGVSEHVRHLRME